MKDAEIASRRKICSKVRRTDVVPAPDDPVTEIMGCLTDTTRHPRSRLSFSDEQPALPKQRGCFGRRRSPEVIALDSVHLLACSENERHALAQKARHPIEDALAASRALAIGLFHQERDRVRLVNQPQPAVAISLSCIARIKVNPAANENAMRLGDHRPGPAHVEVVRAWTVRAC